MKIHTKTRDAAKAKADGDIFSYNAYIKKKERSHIDNLAFYFKILLEEEEK